MKPYKIQHTINITPTTVTKEHLRKHLRDLRFLRNSRLINPVI